MKKFYFILSFVGLMAWAFVCLNGISIWTRIGALILFGSGAAHLGSSLWRGIALDWKNHAEEWKKTADTWRDLAKKSSDANFNLHSQLVNSFVENYLEDTGIENFVVSFSETGLKIKIGDEDDMIQVPIEDNEGDLIAAMEAAVETWRTKQNEN